MTRVRSRAAKRSVSRKSHRRRASEAAVAPTSAHGQLVAVKKSLEAASVALMAIDPNSLSDSQHAKWAGEVNKVDLAIATVRNSLLNGIAEAFEAEIPNIQASTARLESDLARLQRAVDVISAVAGLLGVIEKIISLGR